MILVDDTEASLKSSNSTEYFFRLILARSVFPSDLSEKLISQKNDRFRCNLFYKSESKYQIIKSCEESYLKFFVKVNPIGFIINYFVVFVCFFIIFFINCRKIVNFFLKNRLQILIKQRFY